MQILIPMAGQGEKFIIAGYRTHQPALLTYDRRTGKKIPMVVCAALDLPGVEEDGKNIIFVDRDFHKESGVEEKIRRFYPGARFITTDAPTEGQASTCLLAKDMLELQEELLIAGSDNGMMCDIDALNGLRHECDVIVFAFRHNEAVLKNPNAFGWIAADAEESIQEISVKKPLSKEVLNDYAIAPVFWFKEAKIYIDAAEKMIAANDRINNKFYVDEAIRHVIELGYKARVFEIERYICWNSPEDYEEYQRTYDYWNGFLTRVADEKNIIPFGIGIAGDSASGKSSFLHILELITGKENLLVLEGDGNHKWERESGEWKRYTHLNADANNLYLQADNLQLLKKGAAIKCHEYDHETGRFGQEQRMDPKPYIVLCGLHSFYLPQNRKNLDLKIYMDIDEKLRRFWKIKRDIVERGYELEAVLRQIEDRVPDAERYVEPQKDFADIRIHYYDPKLTDYRDVSYIEKICVQIIMNKEDTICGTIRRLLEYLSGCIQSICCENCMLSFEEDEVKNMPLNVYEIAVSVGIDVKVFFVKHFSLKKASKFPFFSEGISLLSAGLLESLQASF